MTFNIFKSVEKHKCQAFLKLEKIENTSKKYHLKNDILNKNEKN